MYRRGKCVVGEMCCRGSVRRGIVQSEMCQSGKCPRIEFLTFFSELFNIKKTALSKSYYENIDEQEAEEKPENECDERASSKSAKLGSIFQIMYYNRF